MRRDPRTPHLAVVALALVALLASCTPPPPALDTIRARGELRVVTLNGPTSYYLGAHGPEGLEFQLARAFAESLGVNLAIYAVPDARAMQAELKSRRADIAAARISPDRSWNRVGDASEPYDETPQLVVHRRDEPRPRSTLQIENARIAVRAGSAQERMLRRIKNTVAPQMKLVMTAPRTADPLDDVSTGHADYAVVDAFEFSFTRHLYANVAVGFELPQKRQVHWVVRRDSPDLLHAVNAYFASMRESGKLGQLIAEASGEARDFKYLESLRFQEHMLARLPQFRPLFEEAAALTGIDWRLLAAVGYQESKWDPKAESPNGAVGVMMLMASTAESLGVKDRTDPKQNIIAGARYIVEVREKIPARIPEPDRTWMALAAYNIGFGHLEDARVITQKHGKNPDSWADVREHLPLLAQERWFVQVKRGFARGWEPVQFTDRVRSVLQLLEWLPVETVADQVTRVEVSAPDA